MHIKASPPPRPDQKHNVNFVRLGLLMARLKKNEWLDDRGKMVILDEKG